MIVVLASGSGTNFRAVVEAFPGKVQAVICNNEGASVLEKARHAGVPWFLVPHKRFSSRKDHEQAILQVLAQISGTKVIVLAGYMRILSPFFFAEMEKKETAPLIINLHPAHLDQYKGAHGYARACGGLFPRWGLSVHRVTSEVDTGELLGSCEVPVFPYETAADLQNRVRPVEHGLLVSTLQIIFSQGGESL